MNTFSQLVQTLLGIDLEPKQLTFLQVSIRGVIVFVATIVAVRLGAKRSLAEKTAFDAVLAVILGAAETSALPKRIASAELKKCDNRFLRGINLLRGKRLCLNQT